MADRWRGTLQVTGEMLAWISLGELHVNEVLPKHQFEYRAGFGQLTDDKVDCFPDHSFKLQLMWK